MFCPGSSQNNHSGEGEMNKRKLGSFVICAMLFALCLPAEAQQPKMYKIGELTARPGLRRPSEEFLGALRERGYVEGKNIAFEVRSAEGNPDRFPALADELIRLKVDILVASSTAEALAFKNATTTIPIVFYTGGDPVRVGLVDSLARPGGNITGVTLISTELVGKRLELLKETIPTLSRVAVLWNPQSLTMSAWKESLLPARELGLQLHSMEVSSADKLDSAFKEAIRVGSTAIAVQLNPLFAANQKQIVELATKRSLPTIYPRRDFAASGGLMSYGANRDEPFRRAAYLVDRILKGAKPADLPVEQPMKFEFVINLKAAKQIGLTIPPEVLARATTLIK
jgi:putative tryptophan/tyrosine transport system substrate-binding protein